MNNSIFSKHKPFIIAEMSGNHDQSLDRALAIVDAAAKAGAHAIKLQTYTPDTMTLDLDEGEFFITDEDSLWSGQSMHSLYAIAQTPWEWHPAIMERAHQKGLMCFSSPFDESAVEFLESLDVPAYKIASFECIDIPLVRAVARTGKPMVISTGMASLGEIAEAVDVARSEGCNDLVLLKCTSTYPAPAENSNLRTIPYLQKIFGCMVGLSDHTHGVGVAIASVAFGATVIEKHFTLSREGGGVDAAFSLEPHELKILVEEAARAYKSIGRVQFGPGESERKALLRRRSLYISADIKKGERLTPDNLRRVRPGHGLPPKFFDTVLGKRVVRDLKKGTPLKFEMLFQD